MDDSKMKGANTKRPRALWWAASLITLVTALIPAVFIMAAGKNPLAAYAALLSYTLGTSNGFYEVLTQCIPLTLVGLGVAVAFRAGVFNIGGDGQFLMGAMIAFACVPLFADLPAPLGLVLYLLTGFVGGGLLGVLVGWLLVRFKASEIISTIVLNFMVLQLLSWAIRGPLQEPARLMPWSDYLPETLLLPNLIEGSRVHYGLVVAVLAVVVLYILIKKTAFGFRLTAVGCNPLAARYAGLREKRVVVWAMFISAGLAGLAGSVQVAGIHERLQDNFSSGYGQAAIAIALMARLSPLWVPPMAVLFAIFYVGAGVLQREASIPFPIVYIIEGVVMMGFLCFDSISKKKGAS
ncbi:ABC transporter permease [Pusillimonas sp. CC-YST705]|uniref:ABC transporter permease n=1 Tax=Mesopusillimonas faecipullorum TaxID=2755040 RepID=A0ABS8CFQ9_9BURK|nr:ABC transporter permease [Mesopusillimonas faecipullorum]MCB5364881.1 ABC transporter permease [Mesopusillimonas faecipullorum]